MCGLAGFFGTRPIGVDVLDQMKEVLVKRGPDSQRVQTWGADFQHPEGAVFNAMISTRLAIMDPRPEADQPMTNERGDVWISYNGEVFGWESAARELERHGTRFKTHSDTEFVLRAYEAWGIDFVKKLRGMFAIAILDLRSREVFLIRDRMGIKPMVYARVGDGLAYGSTVRSVLPYLTPMERAFSPESIDAYLAHRYIPAPRTIFENVERLENGHYLRFDLVERTSTKHRYWIPRPSHSEWQAELQTALRLQTASDRPVGIWLSSGIDSSLIAKQLVVAGFNNFQAFTATFEGSSMDEGKEAAEFAKSIGLAHWSVPMATRIGDDFDRIVSDLDEPFADPSSFPTWYLSRETARYVPVAIGGDGGDELLAGYKRYGQHLRSSWRGRRRLPGIGVIPTIERKGLSKLISEIGMTWEDSYSLRFSGFMPGQRAFLQPSYKARHKTYWRREAAHLSPVASMINLDMHNYLPEYILRKTDLCSMAHGLEIRVPLLDHCLFESLLTVSERDRFTKPSKMLFQSLFSSSEVEVLWSRKKKGFNPPLRDWLRHDLAPRLPGLGKDLCELSRSQIASSRVDAMVARYSGGAEHFAEQVLQLLILSESLKQLSTGTPG